MTSLKKFLIITSILLLLGSGLFALVHKNQRVREKLVEFADENDLPAIKEYLNEIDYAGDKIEEIVVEKHPFLTEKEKEDAHETRQRRKRNPFNMNESPGGEEMFHWVDKNGVHHYSDTQPHEQEILDQWKKEE